MKKRGLAFVFTLMLPWMAGASAATPPFTGGLFDLYARNRAQQVPNYITEDFLLLAYNLIDRRVTVEREDREIAPRLTGLIKGLARLLNGLPDQDAVAVGNRRFVILLGGLLVDESLQLDGPAAEERGLIMEAKGIAPSPLWGYAIDYSQFKPRGRYTETPELQRYFRTLRYANTVLFAVTPTQATGVSVEAAERMARQAVQLVRLMEQDAELKALRGELMGLLTARFGSGDDLNDEELRQAGARPPKELAPLLLTQARKVKHQPRILSGLVNIDRLEKELTPADALTGWRLIPASYTPESAAFQRLVHPGTGKWLGEGASPVGLGRVGGRPVKAYPLLLELMALLGNNEAAQQLKAQGEMNFENYDQAANDAKAIIATAHGAQQARLAFLGQALQAPAAKTQERQEALLAFWTGIRYGEQLYVKQSYTPVGKGVRIEQPRAGATLEPSSDLYRALATLVQGQGKQTGNKLWQEFAGLLDRIIEISDRLNKGEKPTAGDEEFLNELDVTLLALTGSKDHPIVVDIHTHAEEGMVVEEAVGFALLAKSGAAIGARLDHQEFKQPLAQRLDDMAWAAQLATEIR